MSSITTPAFPGQESPPAATGAEAQALHERRDRIFRSWIRLRKASGMKSGRVHLEVVALLISIATLFAVSPIDAMLSWPVATEVDQLLVFLVGPRGLWLLALLCAVQAWCLEGALRLLLPAPARPRAWLQVSRLLLAAVPIAGFYVFPAWHSLVQYCPAWAFRESPGELGDSRPRPWHRVAPDLDGIWFRVPLVSWTAQALWGGAALLSGLLAVFFWGEWLLLNPEVPGRMRLAKASAYALHGLGFVSMAWGLWKGQREGTLPFLPHPAAPLLALLWLVPSPLLIFTALIGTATLFRRRDREDSLVRQALEKKGQTPEWWRAQISLRDSWRAQPWWRRLLRRKSDLDRQPHATETAQRILLLARFQCVLLMPEAMVLAYAVLVTRGEGLFFFSFVVASFSVGVLAALSTLVRSIRSLWRSAGDGPNLAAYTAGGQLSFLSGFFTASGIHERDQDLVGGSLTIFAIAALVSLLGLRPFVEGWLPLPKEDSTQTRQAVPLVALLGAVFLGGMALWTPFDGWQRADLDLVWIAVFLVLAGDFALGLVLGRWLLLPWKLQQVVVGRMPFRTRVEMLFLIASALLPFSGFVVPAWLHLKRRTLVGAPPPAP
ncbi:MAG: hypothetical protein AAF657_01410 [Acidobacteriota bacterium]